MASSYIDYKDRYVRANDQVLTALAILAKQTPLSGLDDRFRSLADRWFESAISSPPGLIEFSFHANGWSPDAADLREFFKKISQFAISFGGYVPSRVLNDSLQTESITFPDFETRLIKNTINSIVAIVE